MNKGAYDKEACLDISYIIAIKFCNHGYCNRGCISFLLTIKSFKL